MSPSTMALHKSKYIEIIYDHKTDQYQIPMKLTRHSRFFKSSSDWKYDRITLNRDKVQNLVSQVTNNSFTEQELMGGLDGYTCILSFQLENQEFNFVWEGNYCPAEWKILEAFYDHVIELVDTNIILRMFERFKEKYS
ncbi:MAG: hypothetical protein AAGD96_31490 [Chloroflexota bacterium]